MQSFFITLVTALAVSPLTQGLNIPSQPHAVEITGKMEWHGMSNGKNVTLYGLAHEIRDQLMAADPDWVPANQNSTSLPSLRDRSLANSFCCPVAGQPWTPVSLQSVQVAMDHLTEIGGTCAQGPGSCSVANSPDGLTACIFGAGISLCNDAHSTVYLPCSEIATYAYDLITRCGSKNGMMCGQIFDTDSFNVIIRSC